MTDLSATIAPKSDQTNADDLIAGPMTITITSVTKVSGEQPVSIFFEGDNGKPYKPCKSMVRVLVMLWGSEASAFAGRRMTLYRDPEITFGPDKVGGIRISHMSHIDAPKTVALTVTRGRRKPFTVKPLATQPAAHSLTAQTDGGGKAAAPAPSTFPGDAVFYAGAGYDPEYPRALEAPIPIGEMEIHEARAWATALAGLMKRAPRQAQAWFAANTTSILALKARGPAIAARLEQLAQESAGPSQTADEGAPASADGNQGAGAPSLHGEAA